MLRSAIKEDEWMLYAHGAVMGLAGGFIHLAIFGVERMSDEERTRRAQRRELGNGRG